MVVVSTQVPVSVSVSIGQSSHMTSRASQKTPKKERATSGPVLMNIALNGRDQIPVTPISYRRSLVNILVY